MLYCVTDVVDDRCFHLATAAANMQVTADSAHASEASVRRKARLSRIVVANMNLTDEKQE